MADPFPKFSHTYTRYQRLHFEQYLRFRMQMPEAYCAYCLILLYPEEIAYLTLPSLDVNLPCEEWGYSALFHEINLNDIVVCKKHSEVPAVTLNFPGPPIDRYLQQLNYRERGCLAPIKLLSQLTRCRAQGRQYCGHYEQSGSTWTEHNIEFSQMLYGGLLGSPLVRRIMDPINEQLVAEVFAFLQQLNPRLREYDLPDIRRHQQLSSLYKIVKAGETVPSDEGWTHNYLFPLSDVDPSAAEVSLEDLILGIDAHDVQVTYKQLPDVLTRIFPYLFTNGRGYYSLASGHRDTPEEEGGLGDANRRQFTLASYTKTLIQMVDRRFGSCVEFLFFMLDAIEKHNIHSSSRFVVPVQRARHYTRNDVYNNGRFRMEHISLVPHTIRSSVAYQNKRRMNLYNMFKELGGPQLFITLSCDDFAEEYRQLIDGPPWRDPVKFTKHYRRSFKKLFNRYIRGSSFENMVGKITDWSYTIELQDRGSPHVHLVLWTEKSAEELLAMDNMVVAQIPDPEDDIDLYRLVTRRQIHRCGNYCRSNTMSGCRFGYPKESSSESYIDPISDRTVYKRSDIDSFVNPYNPYLLKLTGNSMDIQINRGGRVMLYLAKYLSKTDTTVDLTFGMQDEKSHFRARQVGAVDAALFLTGLSKNRSSRGTVFISLTFPGEDERRTLRPSFQNLPATSTDIFNKTHLQKYLGRHFQLGELTIVEYFTLYRITSEEDANDEFGDEEEHIGRYNREGIDRVERVRLDPRVNKRVPIQCTDSFGIEYKLRAGDKLPFWRTHLYDQTNTEPFFLQQVLLHYAVNDLNHLLYTYGPTWREVFFAVCTHARFNMPAEQVLRIRQIDASIRLERDTTEPGHVTEEQRVQESTVKLASMLPRMSADQNVVYDFFTTKVDTGCNVVYGAAGTGKSYLLQMLYHACVIDYITPVILAPTGISAHSINGQTIHRFFGINVDTGEVNLVRLQDFIKLHHHIAFFIDEASMISSKLVNTINDALQRVYQTNADFGGANIFFFGDMAQLPPINVEEGYFFNNTLIQDAIQFKLNTNQRQREADVSMIRFLHNIRLNNFNNDVFMFIRSRLRLPDEIPTAALRLFPLTADVNNYNNKMADSIVGHVKIFNSNDEGPSRVLNETYLQDTLRLKVNMKCMLLENVDVNAGWSNGMPCTIVNLDRDDMIFVANSNNEVRGITRITRHIYRTNYSRTQFPLTIAYAATVHKVQSLTVTDGVAVSLMSPYRSFGQFYVACSRVTSRDNLYFFGLGSRTTISVGIDEQITYFLQCLDERFR